LEELGFKDLPTAELCEALCAMLGDHFTGAALGEESIKSVGINNDRIMVQTPSPEHANNNE